MKSNPTALTASCPAARSGYMYADPRLPWGKDQLPEALQASSQLEARNLEKGVSGGRVVSYERRTPVHTNPCQDDQAPDHCDRLP